MTREELTNVFKYIVKKCDMLINNDNYEADAYTQENVEDIAELCNHILDGDYGKLEADSGKETEKCMTFYHGTTKENWDAIQREGILYGIRGTIDNNGNIIKEVNRCTYLATDLDEAKCYGDVVLQVEYDPFKHPEKNNYTDGCWQVRVYEPITISKIQEVKS